MTDNQRMLAAYRQSNLEGARIVAADPERYSGLMQEWAALVLRNPDCPACQESRRHQPDEWRHHPAAGTGFNSAHGRPAGQGAKP